MLEVGTCKMISQSETKESVKTRYFAFLEQQVTFMKQQVPCPLQLNFL